MTDSGGGDLHFLPLDALASTLGLPRNWLREEADRGGIPCLRIKQRRYFNAVAVSSVLCRRAIDATPPASQILIKSLRLPVRCRNTLWRMDVKTIGEFLQHSKFDFIRQKNVGPVTFREFMALAAQYGGLTGTDPRDEFLAPPYKAVARIYDHNPDTTP